MSPPSHRTFTSPSSSTATTVPYVPATTCRTFAPVWTLGGAAVCGSSSSDESSDDEPDDELESELIALAAGRGALTWAAVTCNARPALYAATKALAAVSLLPASGASNAARGVPMKNWDLE